jgi:hypothetical protein
MDLQVHISDPYGPALTRITNLLEKRYLRATFNPILSDELTT